MFRTIINGLKAVFCGLFGFLYCPDLVKEACSPIAHPIDRFQEPDPEKVVGACSYCKDEVYDRDDLHQCDCGELICALCSRTCLVCGHYGCRKCMYLNVLLDMTFCVTTGYNDMKKGSVVSECMAKYLGVAEIIISKKKVE